MIRRCQCQPNCQHGVTLIEMLTVIAITAAIFGITSTLFFTLLTGRSDGRQALEQRLNDARLAEQFRHDVHEARTAEVALAEDVPRLQLAQTDARTVEYRFEKGQLERREMLAEKPVRREVYRLERADSVRFEIEKQGGASLVRLAWKETTTPAGMSSEGTSAGRTHELIVLVGRNTVESIRVAATSPDTAEPTGTTP